LRRKLAWLRGKLAWLRGTLALGLVAGVFASGALRLLGAAGVYRALLLLLLELLLLAQLQLLLLLSLHLLLALLIGGVAATLFLCPAAGGLLLLGHLLLPFRSHVGLFLLCRAIGLPLLVDSLLLSALLLLLFSAHPALFRCAVFRAVVVIRARAARHRCDGGCGVL
jgi:hypothetical protein